MSDLSNFSSRSVRIVYIGDNDFTHINLTIGKVYDAGYYWEYYVVVDDLGDKTYHPKYFFKTLNEIRNEKIKNILQEENK